MGFSLRQVEPYFFSVNKNSEVWNTNLDFSEGETILITAASGKGKSSLFRIMTGFNDEYSGEVRFDSNEIRDSGSKNLSAHRKRDWSLVFQSLALFPHLTAEQNIRMTSSGELNMEAAAQLGMESLLTQSTSTLSYGERQRIAIVRALSKPYRFLIMDEPFSHLDRQLREIAWQLMWDDCQKKNAGMILLDLQSHDFVKTDKVLAL
jgi:putative ABC transport system ATP-binding protein